MQLLLSQSDIQYYVASIKNKIIKSPPPPDIIIPIMTGALFFSADLLQALYPDINPMVSPISVFRIPRLTVAGKYQIVVPNSWNTSISGGFQNRRVLLVDTVYDTGATMVAAKRALDRYGPRSVHTAVLIWKNLPDADGKPNFYGVDCQGDASFLYGYGMDNEQRFRGVREIYKV